MEHKIYLVGTPDKSYVKPVIFDTESEARAAIEDDNALRGSCVPIEAKLIY